MRVLDKNYKYIHIFFHDEIMFSKQLVYMFNDKNNDFDIENIAFITSRDRVFENIKDCQNVFLDKRKAEIVIEDCAKHCDFLFIHALNSASRFLKVKNEYLRKIIWRTWGHDVGIKFQSDQFLRNCIKRICFHQTRWKNKINKIKAVGVFNIVDVLNLKSVAKKVPKIAFPYLVSLPEKELATVQKIVKKNDEIKILLGHSGFSSDRHLEFLEQIKNFPLEKVKIFIPISYGHIEYINKLKGYCDKYFKGKIEYLQDMLPLKEYLALINSMDMCVLNGTKSYALGNLAAMVYFGKKIFLHKNGTIKRAFDIENVPYSTVQDIQSLGYEEFFNVKSYSSRDCSLALKSNEDYVQDWHEILKYLDKKESNVKIFME